MHRLKTTRFLLLLLLIASGCLAPPTPAPPTSTPTPPVQGGVLISEVQAGVAGNNNLEFIELYNAGDQVVDLQGWTLWYRLESSTEDMLVYRWRQSALLPPFGHYLLARRGEELGVAADAYFDQALNTSGGGLQLRRKDQQVADALGWGKAPAAFSERQAAPELENGFSLERFPGGAAGNGRDGDDNAADFLLQAQPGPQNTGAPPTPAGQPMLVFRLQAPLSVPPGGEFSYELQLTNQYSQTLHNVSVRFSLPEQLTATGLPEGARLADGAVSWSLDSLDPGEQASASLAVTAPWTYTILQAANAYAGAGGWSGLAFAGPVYTRIEGGVIPLGAARGLVGAELTVEGTATMYTGGYFAGAGNTKFYLEDETGGLQVQVFGGAGVVNVGLGARVRVRGTIGVYRGAAQIVPLALPEDVEILTPSSQGAPWDPVETSLAQAASDQENLAGRLVQVQGTIARLEEFTYSYEIDLSDESGALLTLYVDKETGIRVDSFAEGQLLRATGILEVRDGEQQLYPRLPADLAQVYPPVLMVAVEAPNTVLPGAVFTPTLTVTNYTPQVLSGVQVSLTLPAALAEVAVLDGGEIVGDRVTWRLPELPGGGSQAQVRLALRAEEGRGDFPHISLAEYGALAEEWPEPARGPAVRTFIGESLPVWAIQGDGFRSPYARQTVTTQGVVSGVFPELSGFWIEAPRGDGDPRTSEGVFVSTGELPLPVQRGDRVRVSGEVRELFQQTSVVVDQPEAVILLDQGPLLGSAVELDPPQGEAEAASYYEALEGMLVQVSGPALAVAPTSQYGEFVVVLQNHGVERLWQGEENGFAIMIDDGSSAVRADRTGLAFPVTSGDLVSRIAGPLAFSFGRYKIEPLALPRLDPGPLALGGPPSLAEAGADEFSLMTWNVENLFDLREPHPADPPRPRPAEYARDLEKVAQTIRAAGFPTIVALQEVENLQILEAVAAQPALAGKAYQAVLIEGRDSRGIDVGYLVRGDRAQVLHREQFVAPEGLTSRPPLLVQVLISGPDGETTVSVLNNHFTSMSAGETATEPRRTAQAAWNVTVLADLLAEDPQAHIAVVGDLNSYYQSLPLDTLRQGGLQHVFSAWADPDHPPYTYIYQGESQVLDHILATPGLMALLRRVEILHTNADYPPLEPQDTTPVGKSDHDPVVATFGLQP